MAWKFPPSCTSSAKIFATGIRDPFNTGTPPRISLCISITFWQTFFYFLVAQKKSQIPFLKEMVFVRLLRLFNKPQHISQYKIRHQQTGKYRNRNKYPNLGRRLRLR